MSDRNEWRERLCADFRLFLYVVWKHLGLPDPTPVQYDIANYLQHGPQRRIIMAFRGVGKSWITAAFVCWRLLRDPQRKIEVISASKDLSDAFTVFVMQLITEMPELAHLVPRSDQRNSRVLFDVAPATASKDPSVKSVGIFGQITGTRADDIIADDVEVPNTSETPAARERLANRVTEFDAIIKPGEDKTITFLGTPQTEESLYAKLEERGYSVRIWPARVPDAQRRASYGHKLAPHVAKLIDKKKLKPGTPTDPRRFTDDDLTKREISYGRSGFALQFMLDTSLSDAERYPLKLADLLVYPLTPERAPSKIMWAASPEYLVGDLPAVGFSGDRWYRPAWVADDWIEYNGSVMWIDPSGRGKDETAYAVVKMLNGMLFLTACEGLQGGYTPANLDRICRVAREQRVNTVLIEPNFGDGMFRQLLMPMMFNARKAENGLPAWEGYRCLIEDGERSQKQKEVRIIDTLEPVLNQHRLVVSRDVIERDYKSTLGRPSEKQNAYRLFYQLTRITRDRGALAHDDRLDAVAGAVGYWIEQIGQSIDEAVERQRQEAMQKDLDDFLAGIHGTGPSQPNYLDGLGFARR